MAKRIVRFATQKKHLHEQVKVREYERNGQTKRLGLAQFDSMQEFIGLYENLKDDSWAVMKKRKLDNLDGERERFIFGNKTAYGRSEKVKKLRTINGIVESAKSGFCENVFLKHVEKYRDKINAENIGALQDTMQSIKRVTRFTDDGAELDIDRVMCGDTDYWRTTRRDGRYRVVRLVLNYGMSWDNKPEAFMKLLAMTFVMAELIEAKGYGLEIYATDSVHVRLYGDDKPYLDEQATLIPLKKAQESLDIERMGVVGIVGFFRHVSWIICTLMFGDYNGTCLATTKEMQAFLGADVFIENSWTRGSDTQQVMNITKALDKLERGC